jgi:hypothetical protein
MTSQKRAGGGFGNKTYENSRLLFLLKHPEFENFTPELLGTYCACRAGNFPELAGTPAYIDEAYRHIFVQGCVQCKEHYHLLVELKEAFLYK